MVVEVNCIIESVSSVAFHMVATNSVIFSSSEDATLAQSNKTTNYPATLF